VTATPINAMLVYPPQVSGNHLPSPLCKLFDGNSRHEGRKKSSKSSKKMWPKAVNYLGTFPRNSQCTDEERY